MIQLNDWNLPGSCESTPAGPGASSGRKDSPVTSTSEIRHYQSGGAAVIEAPATFGLGTAHSVRELTIHLQQGGASAIVIDLTAVTSMDNAAVGVLVGARSRVAWLAVAGAGDAANRVLRNAGVTALVPSYPAVPDAVREGPRGREPAAA